MLADRGTEPAAAFVRVEEGLRYAQRMEALGHLASGIAHDLGNLLQVVSSGLSLIERRAEDAASVRRLARMASDAVGRGAGVTDRLLAFARKGALLPAAIEPRPFLESLQGVLASALGAAVTVQVEAAPDAPALRADKAQLETVMINLAVNARDAMPEGGTLHIAAAAEIVTDTEHHPAQLAAGAYMRMTLRDTGAGMDAATLSRAAEPFFTTKPEDHGTGLGLAMARSFARQSGGGLALSSAVGEGTTVTLWLPLDGDA